MKKLSAIEMESTQGGFLILLGVAVAFLGGLALGWWATNKVEEMVQ